MLYVGIDVAKRKHDCFIMDEHGETLEDVFTIQNSREGFEELRNRIESHVPCPSPGNTIVGLEATGHYSDNIVGFLRKIGLPPIVLNPLRVSLCQKSQSLRKTRTDKIAARFIAKMVMAEGLEPHLGQSYHRDELKSLTRYRQRMVKARSTLKVSYDRLLTICFPELEGFVGDTLGATMKKLLLEFPSARAIAGCHATRLANLAAGHSRGRYKKEWAVRLKELAKGSIGTHSPAKAFELQQTIRQIMYLDRDIEMVEKDIEAYVMMSGTTLTTIRGISYTFAAIIIAEIGDIFRFGSPGKLQAFAGLEPTRYQSGQYASNKDVMVKRGSKYLRWALVMAARSVSQHDSAFREYLGSKLAEGKHYNCAMGHVAKKLIRLVYHLMATGEDYQAKA